MHDQLVNDPEALKMFFTEPVFLVPDAAQTPAEIIPPHTAPSIVPEKTIPVTNIPAPKATSYQYIGENKRNILIVVNDPENDVANDQGKEMLRNLMKHLGIGGKDFAMINFHRYPDANFQLLNDFFQVRSAFFFGVTPADIGIAANENFQKVGGASLYFAANLSNMEMADKKSLNALLKNFSL